jgi:hypothetical protein
MRRSLVCRSLMRPSLLWSAIGLVALSSAVIAEPARIIILRHAEKLNAHELCAVGAERAQALAKQFLGRGAAHSLFRDQDAPAAFLAITLHTIETISPVAQTWGLPVTAYTISPGDDDEKEAELNQRTREAARDALGNPAYAGKTVVMIWEHKHIAHRKLEKNYPHEKVTLRQLLQLEEIKDVPEDWPEDTYDFFWIVEYEQGKPAPARFRMMRQDFTAPFDHLPANGWDEAEPKHGKAGCKK